MYGLVLSVLNELASAWWWSAGLGIGIGLLYGAASFVANRYALRQNQQVFMLVVIGGMTVRMVVALVAVTLIMWLLPVEQAAFLVSFLGVFIIGIIVEVRHLHHRLLAVRNP